MGKNDLRPGGLPMNEAPADLRHSVGIPDASLIERIEDAERPSRELDAEIALATAWRDCLPCAFKGIKSRFGGAMLPPQFTASIDAAMTLVPLNYGEVDFDLSRDIDGWSALVSSGDNAWRTTGGAKAKTPALALCAAALRAAIADQSPEGGDACGSIHASGGGKANRQNPKGAS